jgi:hypothetical protein
VVLKHCDCDCDHDGRRPQREDHRGLEVGERPVRGDQEEDDDHDHRDGGEPDDLPPQQASAPAPTDGQRRESDQPAEADDGRPEVPLGKIENGREVVLVLQRRDHDQSCRDAEQDVPEPSGQRSVRVELRQYRQREPNEEVGRDAVCDEQRLGEPAVLQDRVPPESGKQ